MNEFVIVSHKFQIQICKVKPLPIGVYSSFENAELKRKRLHIEEWSKIIKEGIRNDTFSYYAEDIKSRGYNFDKDATEQEIYDFVAFIDTGEVDNPFTMRKVNLKPLRIIEIETVTAVINNYDSTTRYLIKEDELNCAGENRCNVPNNKYGTPIFVTDEIEIAKSKIEELEYHKFIKKVLSGNARMNIETSLYYKETTGASEEQLNEIEARLIQKGVSWNRPTSIKQVMEIKQAILEIVGVGLIDNFFSIDTFEVIK
jgi:UDP-galactopyranose mutase